MTFPVNRRPIDEVDHIIEQARVFGYRAMLRDAVEVFGMTPIEMDAFLRRNAADLCPPTAAKVSA